jgi:hypothetical protein
MILTGENRNNRRETCPVATLSATNSTSTGLRSEGSLSNDRQAPDRLSHGIQRSQYFMKITTGILRTAV